MIIQRILVMGRVLLIALCCMIPAAASAENSETPPAHSAVAQGARLGGDNSQTRLIIDLSSQVQASVSAMENPFRIIIDLPDVSFREENTDQEGRSRGLVKGFRFGHISDTHSRVVVDVTQPVAVSEPEIIAAIDGQPARLVVTFRPVDQDAFRQQEAFKKGLEAAKVIAEKPEDAAPKEEAAIKAEDSGKRIIVLDPGHGGIDVGARAASGEEEKDIVLMFSRALKENIEKTGRYKVFLTRDSDKFITLDGRVSFARRHQAALFISVHADSLANPFGVRGATIYTLSERASDQAAALLAEKENLSDANAGFQVSEDNNGVVDILFDLTQRETKVFSAAFARLVKRSVQGAMELNKNPIRSARFRVLRAYDVPSVLLELGYMSNQKDLAQLTSPQWRQKASSSLVKAIDAFFGSQNEAVVGTIPRP